jgi:predicted MPP superfamily phosphohydrolase
MAILLLLGALVGHLYLAAVVFNHLHACNMPIRLCKLLTAVQLLVVAAVPPTAAYAIVSAGPDLWDYQAWFRRLPWHAQAYGFACAAAGVGGSAWWAWRRARRRPSAVVRFHRRRRVDLSRAPEGRPAASNAHHALARLPGNQCLLVEVSERGLELPRLPRALDGLTIVQLSDLHFTGRIGKSYFRDVVRMSNEIEPDLVAITGDVVDHARYVNWIPETLGELTSRFGVYFVLGNHDVRASKGGLRQAMVDCGMVDLGGRWVQREIRGEPVVLAGNELPWFGSGAALPRALPSAAGKRPVRIALAHSPDQIGWARACDVDLLLAGHTHGGQICLPVLGAVVTATRLGARYASGAFHLAPTVLHVSRGVSAEIPLRFFCPAELVKLTLHAGSPGPPR